MQHSYHARRHSPYNVQGQSSRSYDILYAFTRNVRHVSASRTSWYDLSAFAADRFILPFFVPQSKKRLERTKTLLQFGTALYITLLLLMSMFGQLEYAMVVQLGAIGVGLTACGSGAAKVSVGATPALFYEPVDYGEENTNMKLAGGPLVKHQ